MAFESYKLEFQSLPPPYIMLSNLSTPQERLSNFHTALTDLLVQGVIAIVPQVERFLDFNLNRPLRFKKLRGKVTHIGSQNSEFVHSSANISHGASNRSVISSLHQGDFLASVDIKDVYLDVPIFPKH